MAQGKTFSPEEILQFVMTEVHRVSLQRVDPHTPLFSRGLLDSVSTVEMVVGIESQFGISLDPARLNKETTDTPQLLADYIGSALQSLER